MKEMISILFGEWVADVETGPYLPRGRWQVNLSDPHLLGLEKEDDNNCSAQLAGVSQGSNGMTCSSDVKSYD